MYVVGDYFGTFRKLHYGYQRTITSL